MPTPTDLVTSLPADFEVFGQAVDSTLADLKGGTTGQVLSKNSNTDMDFVWVTDAAGDITGVTAGTGISGGGTSGTVTITNSMATEITAKGDLIVGTGSATFDNLAAGANGSTLVADSSTSTGLRYQIGNGLAQGAINGGFDVWQRGTSFSAPNYCADRWYANGGNATYAQEATAANLPTGFRYGIKMTMSATNVPFILQAIETSNAIYYAGQRVVLSYYVSSSASSSAKVGLDYSTAQDVGVTGTWTALSAASGFSITQSTTTSMTRVFCAFDVPSTAQSLRINVGSIVNITSGNSMTITGIQLELGSVPTQFRRAGGTIQGELSADKYYYRRQGGSTAFEMIGMGTASSTTVANIIVPFDNPMRVAPTSVDYSTLRLTDLASGYPVTALSLDVNFNSKNVGVASVTVASGLTVGKLYYLSANNSTSAYLGFSAEL